MLRSGGPSCSLLRGRCLSTAVTARDEKLIRSTFLDFQSHDAFLQKPLIMQSAKRMEYFDSSGARYLDGIGGIFTCSLGHGHAPVVEAAKRQLDVMTFAPPMHSVSDVTLNFVEALGAVTPGDLNFVKTYCSASEAMESAIKWTRSYHKLAGNPGKYKFVSRYDSWHGATAGAVAASGGASRKSPHEPHMAGFLKVPGHPLSYRERQPWEEAECNRFCAQLFEDVIVNEDPATIAGVIVEPISNTAGIMTPTLEYNRMVRDICTKYDVTMIFDETITGFCKTGSMFASQAYGVTPDMIVCGKGVSNGTAPLSAMIASDRMTEVFQAGGDASMFAHGQTFAGQPLGCAVGLAVLDEMTSRDLPARAAELGGLLRAELEGLKDLGCVREVRGMGVLLGVELQTPEGRPWPELGAAMKVHSLKNGLILRADPKGWFALAPALCATEADIEELSTLVRKSLKDSLDAVTRGDTHEHKFI